MQGIGPDLGGDALFCQTFHDLVPFGHKYAAGLERVFCFGMFPGDCYAGDIF